MSAPTKAEPITAHVRGLARELDLFGDPSREGHVFLILEMDASAAVEIVSVTHVSARVTASVTVTEVSAPDEPPPPPPAPVHEFWRLNNAAIAASEAVEDAALKAFDAYNEANS